MTAWRNSPAPRFDTVLLAVLASTALIVARAQAAWNPSWMTARLGCELLVAIALSVALRRRARQLERSRWYVAIGVSAAAFYPFAMEFALRRFAEGSEPLEMVMLSSLQLSAVVLAVFAYLPRLGGTAVILSSFLLLFTATIHSDFYVLSLAGIFGVLGLWWLMGAYWDRLAGALVAANVERRIPLRVSVISGTLIAIGVLATLVGANRGRSAVALQGIMPTSGGTLWHDLHARSGVGDGDAVIAAKEQAMSFGPVESDLFLDSDMPSLYDMFNDLYGDPPSPRKRQERTIGLAPRAEEESEQRMAQTERSGREFSAVRRKVSRKRETLDDRAAAAMLYVVGRVPLHLALERYDTFDGRQWTRSDAPEKRAEIRLEWEGGKPWAYVMRLGEMPVHRGLEPHAVKIINLKTNRFPSPPQLTALHIDKVDQPDFFGWTDDGTVQMPAREKIPQLTVVHLRSQGVHLEPLRHGEPPVARVGWHPDDEHPYAHVVGRWTRGVPRGWRQVEAVVGRLRSEFTCDPHAPAPETCTDVVAHFLQAKRGPDYLFATTAAVLLHELGYETRLVTGFYARKDRFDARARQTEVLGEDVHTWVEVSLNGRHWLTIEPTPGFEPPPETLTWSQHVARAFSASIAWCLRNAAALFCGVCLGFVVFRTRRAWLDAIAQGVCHVLGQTSIRARLLWTIRLIEWRAWLIGCSRPRQRTVSAWYAPLKHAVPADAGPALAEFLNWTDRILYGPPDLVPARHDEIVAACRSVIAASAPTRLARCMDFDSERSRVRPAPPYGARKPHTHHPKSMSHRE